VKFQSINLRKNRFGFEPEITAKIDPIPKERIHGVGIPYYDMTYECEKRWDGGTDYRRGTASSSTICSDKTRVPKS
jgi:hypothetical protein